MTETRFRYKSIDDYLGPAETRFFGCGHRCAKYQVGHVAVTPAADPGVGARADVTVSYPTDWSRKGDNVDAASGSRLR